MTDQTAPDVTNNERRLARDWAEHIESNTAIWAGTARVRAAARVILNDVPAPPRPTLADMTPKERVACRLMQADVEEGESRAVIINPHWEDGSARVLWPGGIIGHVGWEYVTPRPDLPRMEWPGDQKPAPAPALPHGWRLADHRDHGRVIVTTQTPNDDGRVYFVLPVCRNLMGFDWRACDPDELTYLDQEADPLAVGTVIESADDPRIAALPVGSILLDREGETVTKRCESWTGLGGAPYGHDGAEFGPWTVLHIPGGQWHQVTRWSHEPPLNDGYTLAPDERVVRRYVTAPQPLEGEHP